MKTFLRNDLTTDPESIQMATTELIPFRWDATALLEVGDSVSNASAIVRRFHPRPVEDISGAVSGSPSIDTNTITVTIDGSVLDEGDRYFVLVSFDANVGKTLTMQTLLECIT